MADPLSAAPNAAVLDVRSEMRQFPHRGVLRSISWPPFVFAGYTIYCAWFVYFLLVIKGGQASSGASTFWVNLLGVPFELVALLASWYASRSLDLDDKTRHAWRLLAWSYLGSWLVNVGWLYFDSILGGVPLPWWMRVFSYSHYVIALWALLSFPKTPSRGSNRATFALDASIVALGGGVIAWHVLFRSTLERIGGDILKVAYMLGYPVGGMLLFFCVVALLLRRPEARTMWALRALGAAYLIYLAADTLFVRARVFQVPLSGGMLDAMYVGGAWMAALAALLQRSPWTRRFRLRTESVERAPSAPSAPSLLPYLAAAAVFAALILESLSITTGSKSVAPITVLALATMIITAIVGARQIAAQRANARLVAEHRARDARFRALVEHASDLILVLDADGVIRDASPSVWRVLGRNRDELVGTPMAALAGEDDAELVQADLGQVSAMNGASAKGAAPCEWRLQHATLGVRWMEVLCTNLLGNPAVNGIVVNARDVSERKALEAELTHRAFHDELTGLDNRARFLTVVMQTVRRLGHPSAIETETGARGVAVLYLDLDEFKPINDTHGHAAGDQVLATVAERLRDATRGSDTVARLGGDEFAVLIGGVRNLDDVTIVSDRIQRALSRSIPHRGLELRVGASIGAAWLGTRHLAIRLAREPAGDVPGVVHSLLRAADRSMYMAKADGGHRTVICTPEELLAQPAI
jgi:diguanylate cyclase (GGDEF)-like protein/PAS domain S-box-containing protein